MKAELLILMGATGSSITSWLKPLIPKRTIEAIVVVIETCERMIENYNLIP